MFSFAAANLFLKGLLIGDVRDVRISESERSAAAVLPAAYPVPIPFSYRRVTGRPSGNAHQRRIYRRALNRAQSDLGSGVVIGGSVRVIKIAQA